MKKYLMGVLFLVAIITPIKVNAAYDALISGNTVRIRSGAGTNNSIIATVNANTAISVFDKTLYEGTGCSEKWYKILYNEKTGYVCKTYVSFIDTSFDGINIMNWSARVNANNVTVRSEANKNSNSKGTLTLGANVLIQDTVSGGTSGCSTGKWHKIKYYSDSEGYICSNYVTKKTDVISNDAEYEKSLKDMGFPDSYLPYLVYLHKKFPNWIFKPSNTNASFSVSVNSEYGKCYMQTTNDNYRTSSKAAEGSSWFYANKGVIAFYLDPRNWLTEERIFMFEKLDYSTELESTYTSLVKAIFGSGTLGDDKYTTPMVNAGKTNSISPVHIASRIRLEVGKNGSDSTNGESFTWKGKTYSGYYNFFNIGAYETTIDGVNYSAITRGLAYAAKLFDRSGNVWNNIETSITEGSSFLANGYVNKGQGTLYYQKFNTGPNAYYSKYTHQYMTNIQAPATEGNQSYNSYNSADVTASPFIFEIPVYSNMPEYTSLPNSGNPDNYLSSLSVSGYSISPSFDEDILTYDAYVPSNTDKVTINATAKSSTSVVTGPGEIELPSEENTVTIKVVSQSGDVRTYSISIHKASNATQSTTTAESVVNSLSYNVNGDTINKIKNKSSVDDIQNNAIKNGATSVVTKNQKGEVVSGNNNIGTGYTITITTPTNSQTYNVSVSGDTSGDGKVDILDLLIVQKNIKKAQNLSGVYATAGDVSGDGKVDILDLLMVQKYIKGAGSL